MVFGYQISVRLRLWPRVGRRRHDTRPETKDRSPAAKSASTFSRTFLISFILLILFIISLSNLLFRANFSVGFQLFTAEMSLAVIATGFSVFGFQLSGLGHASPLAQGRAPPPRHPP
jgi:hypothetical protein